MKNGIARTGASVTPIKTEERGPLDRLVAKLIGFAAVAKAVEGFPSPESKTKVLGSAAPGSTPASKVICGKDLTEQIDALSKQPGVTGNEATALRQIRNIFQINKWNIATPIEEAQRQSMGTVHDLDEVANTVVLMRGWVKKLDDETKASVDSISGDYKASLPAEVQEEIADYMHAQDEIREMLTTISDVIERWQGVAVQRAFEMSAPDAKNAGL